MAASVAALRSARHGAARLAASRVLASSCTTATTTTTVVSHVVATSGAAVRPLSSASYAASSSEAARSPALQTVSLFGNRSATRLARYVAPTMPIQVRMFAAAAGDSTTIVVPPIADSITEGTIEKILKKVGDSVEQDELLVSLETDKVNLEIRSPKKGVVTEIFVAVGESVRVGANLLNIAIGGAAANAAPAEKPKGKVAKEPVDKGPAKAAAPKEAAKPADAAPAPAPTPAAAAAAPAAPAAAAEAPRGISGLRETRVPISRMRERIAQRLKDSQNTAAMLTTFQEVDMHNILQLREEFKDEFFKRHGAKLGLMSAFVKASTEALKQVPAINASIDDATKEIVYYQDVDISIAVATPKGLVTPVLRDCDRMTFADVEKEIAALGEKARQGKISIAELSGGTFTISNGGVYGSLMGTPIINPPQSAILGMHGINKRPVVVGDQILIRPVMYIALTYDHRLIDGREAVTFLRSVKHYVEDPRRLLLQL